MYKYVRQKRTTNVFYSQVQHKHLHHINSHVADISVKYQPIFTTLNNTELGGGVERDPQAFCWGRFDKQLGGSNPQQFKHSLLARIPTLTNELPQHSLAI